MKIMSVVGARPNFMKVAPIITAINEHNVSCATDQPIEHILVHTGQHYDRLMSDSFFADLGLPDPDVHLGVGSGSHAAQTAEIMKKFEEVLIRERPDVLVVVGDVNSTVACALVASKISLNTSGARPVIAHVEAGLRSFDRTMPEELNRIVTDHLSDLLFVTEQSGMRNLKREGITMEKVHFVGNTMIDSLLACSEKASSSSILDKLSLRRCDGPSVEIKRYVLLTLHRAANVDHRDVLLSIFNGLEPLAPQYQIVFPAHPRTRKRITDFGLSRLFDWTYTTRDSATVARTSHSPHVRIIEPLGYLDFLHLMSHASLVVTDSGGIQEETTCLGVPCVTVRDNTERPVTLRLGTNLLAGVDSISIRNAIAHQLRRTQQRSLPPMWDGKSAQRILAILKTRPCSPDSTTRGHSAYPEAS